MPLASTFGVAAARAYGLFARAVQAVDQYFNYVTLLLPGNGTNGAQNNTFLDSSTNNFTITRNGNTTQGTFSPFSQTGWSNYSSGNGSDYLSLSSSSSWAFGTGDFTIECWLYYPANQYDTVTNYICGNQVSSDNATWSWGVSATTKKLGFSNWTTNLLLGNTAIPTDQWVHLVCLRQSSTLKFYINGLLDNSAADTTNFSTSAVLTIFRTAYTSLRGLTGYISNLRVVKGTAVYTSNFTPPTAPLTAITNTSLLTCQSNRFIDNSTNNFAITRNGDVSVQAFSPFNPTAAWSAATNGGSGYFDGSGDYLTAPDNAALNLGTSDFTLEGWVYITGFPGSNTMAMIGKWASANYAYIIQLLSPSTLRFYTGNSGSLSSFYDQTYTWVLNSWTHIAITRQSNTLRFFVNGLLIGSNAGVTQSLSNSSSLVFGQNLDGGGQDFTGYVSSARIVKGTAVYTSNFTPPTAPLTAITNTSLLLNFTNAGIYDAAAKNDLETVGNAQISTTQSKWGGSSMYFDGTGDWLLGAQNANLSANSDFTVEVWGYIVSGSQTIATYANTSGQTQWRLRVAGGKAEFEWVNNTPTVFAATGTSTLATGQWIYLAATLSGTTLRIFVNGTLEASTTVSGAARNQANPAFFVGQDGIGASNFNGYLQDLRITKGVARYTSNFSVPTAPFPVIGGGTQFNIEYLVVAGGGGGYDAGVDYTPGNGYLAAPGGGGAGGYRTSSAFQVRQGFTYAVVVGAGGARNASGNDSAFWSITSAGGGRGNSSAYGTVPANGVSGGSGGGGGSYNQEAGVPGTIFIGTGGAGNTPATSPSQGNSGGTSTGSGSWPASLAGGGGGGSAGAGGATTGGPGTANSITGTSVTYAAGGTAGFTSGNAGAANTGNGGAGGDGSGNVPGTYGKAGGSGIVVIKYPDTFSAATTTGSPTVTVSGGYRIYVFNSSGTITF